MSQDIYSVPMQCTNCGHEGEADFLRGQGTQTAECPNCGTDHWAPRPDKKHAKHAERMLADVIKHWQKRD